MDIDISRAGSTPVLVVRLPARVTDRRTVPPSTNESKRAERTHRVPHREGYCRVRVGARRCQGQDQARRRADRRALARGAALLRGTSGASGRGGTWSGARGGNGGCVRASDPRPSGTRGRPAYGQIADRGNFLRSTLAGSSAVRQGGRHSRGWPGALYRRGDEATERD